MDIDAPKSTLVNHCGKFVTFLVSYSLPLFSFVVCLISRKKCLRSGGASCFEIASRLICLPWFSWKQDCKRCTDVLALSFSVLWNHVVLKRDQFLTCIGYNCLLFRQRCLTFFGIDTCLGFFRDACWVFLGENCRLAFYPRLCHFSFFFSAFSRTFELSGLLKFLWPLSS